MDGDPKYYLVYLFSICVDKQDTLIAEMCLSMVLDESYVILTFQFGNLRQIT